MGGLTDKALAVEGIDRHDTGGHLHMNRTSLSWPTSMAMTRRPMATPYCTARWPSPPAAGGKGLRMI